MKQIVAYTPHGKFTSGSFPEDDLAPTRELLEQVSDLKYFVMYTDQGGIYLPKPVIQQSVFAIEDADND
jgi:hypothetical protein